MPECFSNSDMRILNQCKEEIAERAEARGGGIAWVLIEEGARLQGKQAKVGYSN